MNKLARLIVGLTLFFAGLYVYKEAIEKNTINPDSSNKKVLIGLLTLPEKYERRFLVRTFYGKMESPLAKLYFVVCNPTNTTMRDLIIAEKTFYDDILVLDCVENMDDGKTFTFFSSLPKLFKNSTFEYVMKTDDDVFLHIPNLVTKLLTLSNKGLYYGRDVPNHGFMAGMGYVISWDLVEWIATAEYPKLHREGQEDATLASWLHHSGLLKHTVSDDNAIYDDPDSGKGWAKPYIPETILIHRLKDTLAFIKANVHFMRPLFSKLDI